MPTYTGNLTAGNILTNNYLYANGQPFTPGTNYSNANVAAYLPVYTGNILANSITAVGIVTTGGSDSNITGANVISANTILVGGIITSGGNNSNITGANVISANTIIAGGIITSGGTNSNITGANVISATTLTTTKLFVTASSSPASSSTGVPGQIAWDSGNIYVCIATNTWARSPLIGGY